MAEKQIKKHLYLFNRITCRLYTDIKFCWYSLQFKEQQKDLEKQCDQLNKKKSDLLLQVGKLEQEAQVCIPTISLYYKYITWLPSSV